MAMTASKCERQRRKAMLSIFERVYPWQNVPSPDWKPKEIARVPVFVWTMPTLDGCFIVEHQDGTVQKVQPDALTFLDGKELFNQCDWSLQAERTGNGNDNLQM